MAVVENIALVSTGIGYMGGGGHGPRIWNRALSPADVQLLFEMEHRFFEV